VKEGGELKDAPDGSRANVSILCLSSFLNIYCDGEILLAVNALTGNYFCSVCIKHSSVRYCLHAYAHYGGWRQRYARRCAAQIAALTASVTYCACDLVLEREAFRMFCVRTAAATMPVRMWRLCLGVSPD